ncbi:MAG: choice-of-anchor B family protein [Chitinophagales bacterium]|nr:choice-of-anchor B family protein [Chitinophagales bacterium]
MKTLFWALSPFLFACFASITLQAQNEMPLLGSKFYPDGLSSLWGYTDSEGREYALVGVKSGTSIVDISDPANPNELFFVPDDFNIWREIKTWQSYAYVVDEVDGGVTIIDLSQLPTAIDTFQFTAQGRVKRVHSLWIDENGFLYLNGFNNMALDIPVAERGVMMFDLNPDPTQPTYINTYKGNYAHDCFVRDDMMYVSEIYAGQLSIVDISDKLNPVLLATQTTPNAFTHNAWLSDDSHTIFTTDERDGATMAAYDISDLNDIRELDRYQAYPGTNTMPHNAHVLNDFIILSYYTAGFRVIDAHVPDALVETEYYDTSPNTGGGSAGCWGVYQYLPSGNLIASDRQQGLFITRPQYQRASYLQGNITDALSGAGVAGVRISIVGTSSFDQSRFGGTYRMGTANSGTYDIMFEKYGYQPLTISSITLNEAQFTDLDVQMQPLSPFALQVQVNDSYGNGLPNVVLEVRNSWASSSSEGIYALTTNSAGLASIEGLYDDTYIISASRWGLLPTLPFADTANNANATITIVMPYGYYDDFATDLGWTVESTDTMTGQWLRVVPTGTQGASSCTFYSDAPDDWGGYCYTTADGYAPPEDVDLDNGSTRLLSPAVDLSGYATAALHFDLYYCLANEANATDATCNIYNGSNGDLLFSTLLVDTLQNGSNAWRSFVLPLDALIAETPNTYFVIEARNNGSAGIVEVAFDKFAIVGTNNSADIADIPTANIPQLSAAPSIFEQQTNIIMRPAATANNNNLDGAATLQIFDLYGRLVAQQTLLPNSSWQWGAQVPAGSYWVRCGNQQLKLIKTGY